MASALPSECLALVLYQNHPFRSVSEKVVIQNFTKEVWLPPSGLVALTLQTEYQSELVGA